MTPVADPRMQERQGRGGLPRSRAADARIGMAAGLAEDEWGFEGGLGDRKPACRCGLDGHFLVHR
jgi:hypothetical protein